MTPDDIKGFWTEQARIYGSLPAASWSDVEAMALERRTLTPWLAAAQTALDIGCGNGLSTLAYAQAHPTLQIRGVDYVPEMIDTAQQLLALASDDVRRRVTFSVGDLLDPELPSLVGAADRVICTRVLINLSTWVAQRMALAALAPLVLPGGVLLLSEATLDGFIKLSHLRTEWHLPPLTIPPFNTYLSVEAVLTEARYRYHVVAVIDFASSYYVLTRVLKPILAHGRSIDATNPAMLFNQWAAHLPPAGDFGIQKLFVLLRPNPAAWPPQAPAPAPHSPMPIPGLFDMTPAP